MKATGWMIVLAALAVGCSGGAETTEPAPAPASADGSDPQARTLPIPQGDLPAGHPPLDETAGGPLSWSVPDSWTQEQPASSMRWAQYRVTGAAGDGECIVFYFGPGQGGDPASNARRWAGQFAQPDGRDSTDVMVFEKLEDTALPTHIVEVTGTYDGGMSGPMDAAGYMLLGGIVEGPDAPWFFKFIGPEETVRANRSAFLEMMGSVRTNG